MQIQILSATPKQLPAKTPGKTYSALELAYKNLTFQGKVEGKNLVGFGNGKAAYDTLMKAQPGDVYEIEVTKNAAGYNDWVAATKSDSSATTSPTPNVGNTTRAPQTSLGTTTSPKSTYETPEERAKKQVYIVRQSSISNAVDLLSVGSKSKPDVDEVLQVAKRFEDYVFGNSDEKAVTEGFFPETKKGDFTEVFDDIPL